MSKVLKNIYYHFDKNVKYLLSTFEHNFFKNRQIRYLSISKFQQATSKFNALSLAPCIVFHPKIFSKIHLMCYVITPFLKIHNELSSYRNPFEVEKEISKLVTNAESFVISGNYEEAKILLKKALEIAEKTCVFSNISSVYDLLSTIAFQEGGIAEAENLLVNFIEKLIQLGYPENHNSVVRFKLKLSRFNQIIGNYEMAELGFQDCINTQEMKLNKNGNFDELTNLIYINSLFWYGNLLFNNEEFKKAKIYLQKALNRIHQSTIVSPAQAMVVLYFNADICVQLNEYDQALEYLYNAIDICHSQDKSNPDLPLHMIKIGTIYTLKGLYESAENWCTDASKLALKLNNGFANKKANICLKQLEDLKSNQLTIENLFRHTINIIFQNN